MTYSITKSIGSIFATLFEKNSMMAIIFASGTVTVMSLYNNFLFRIEAQAYFIRVLNNFNYQLYAMNSQLILVYGLGRCFGHQSSRVLIDYQIEGNQELFWDYMAYFFISYIVITLLELFVFIFKSDLARIDFHKPLLKKKVMKNQNEIECTELTVASTNYELKTTEKIIQNVVPGQMMISWINISYKIVKHNIFRENHIQILNNISGYFETNTLNALMGPSGAGKTTLLNCFIGRIMSSLSEESKIFASKGIMKSSFIVQDTSQHLMEGLTVRQTLLYASKLKNSEILKNLPHSTQHNQIVNDLMAELLISDTADNRVESCSGGEKKRIVIASELTAYRKPNVLLIDEPTSGLDSTAAEVIISCLKRLSRSHRISIITSIHQPNQDLMHIFDNIYVLAKGGVCVYSGLPQNLRQHLNDCHIDCNQNDVPIEVLLRVSSEDTKTDSINRMNEKMIDENKNLFEKSLKQNMRQISENPNISKRFSFKDFWNLVLRTIIYNSKSQGKGWLLLVTLIIACAFIFRQHLNPDLIVPDGCLDKELSIGCNQTLEEIHDEYLIRENIKCIGISMVLLTFVSILYMSLTFITEFNIFINERRNGKWSIFNLII